VNKKKTDNNLFFQKYQLFVDYFLKNSYYKG